MMASQSSLFGVVLSIVIFLIGSTISHEIVDDLDHLDYDEDGHSCGTPRPTRSQEDLLNEATEEWKRRNRHRRLSDISINIPVHFVVLQAEDGRGAITDAEIEQGMIGKLNYGFRGSPFSFSLESIRRDYNDTYFKCQEKVEFQKKYKVGGPDTLNVYICNVFAIRFGVYGFAALEPDSVEDGVVLMNPALPKADLSYKLMNNLFVHETAHWLGLFHTFHNGCEAGGDSVSDTPAHAKSTSRTPGVSSCWRDVQPPLDTCPNDSPDVDAGLDPIDNYMNFIYFKTGDWGHCYEEYGRFTPGQLERMTAVFETQRVVSPTHAPVAAPVTAKPTFPPVPDISLPIVDKAPAPTLTPESPDVASQFSDVQEDNASSAWSCSLSLCFGMAFMATNW